MEKCVLVSLDGVQISDNGKYMEMDRNVAYRMLLAIGTSLAYTDTVATALRKDSDVADNTTEGVVDKSKELLPERPRLR